MLARLADAAYERTRVPAWWFLAIYAASAVSHFLLVEVRVGFSPVLDLHDNGAYLGSWVFWRSWGAETLGFERDDYIRSIIGPGLTLWPFIGAFGETHGLYAYGAMTNAVIPLAAMTFACSMRRPPRQVLLTGFGVGSFALISVVAGPASLALAAIFYLWGGLVQRRWILVATMLFLLPSLSPPFAIAGVLAAVLVWSVNPARSTALSAIGGVAAGGLAYIAQPTTSGDGYPWCGIHWFDSLWIYIALPMLAVSFYLLVVRSGAPMTIRAILVFWLIAAVAYIVLPLDWHPYRTTISKAYGTALAGGVMLAAMHLPARRWADVAFSSSLVLIISIVMQFGVEQYPGGWSTPPVRMPSEIRLQLMRENPDITYHRRDVLLLRAVDRVDGYRQHPYTCESPQFPDRFGEYAHRETGA